MKICYCWKSSRSCIVDFGYRRCEQWMMALELAFIGVVVGIVLGLRYKVLILVPVIMFAILSAITLGVVRADRLWSILVMIVALVTAVQLGYLAGVVIRAGIGLFRSLRKGGTNSDSEIGYAWQRLNGWARPGTIVQLHPLR